MGTAQFTLIVLLSPARQLRPSLAPDDNAFSGGLLPNNIHNGCARRIAIIVKVVNFQLTSTFQKIILLLNETASTHVVLQIESAPLEFWNHPCLWSTAVALNGFCALN